MLGRLSDEMKAGKLCSEYTLWIKRLLSVKLKHDILKICVWQSGTVPHTFNLGTRQTEAKACLEVQDEPSQQWFQARQSGPVESSIPGTMKGEVSESSFGTMYQFVSVHMWRGCGCMCLMGLGTTSVFVTILCMCVCIGMELIWECDYVCACDYVPVSACVLGLWLYL